MVNVGELVSKHVPVPWFASAVDVTRAIGDRLMGDQARREAAVLVLIHDLHVPEHLARLLVELAVLWLKHENGPLRSTV